MNRLARLARLYAVEHRSALRAARDTEQRAVRARQGLARIDVLLATLAPAVSQDAIGAADLAASAAKRGALCVARAAAHEHNGLTTRQSADAVRVIAMTRARADVVARLRREREKAKQDAADRRAFENAPLLASRLQIGSGGGRGR